MRDLIWFALVVLGVIYVVTQSRVGALIRKPLRALLGKYEGLAFFFYCPACFGFWVGLVLGPHFGYQPLQAAFAACALGALWGEYGSSLDPWDVEKPRRD